MKIEIDTDELLGGEEYVREQVISTISQNIQSGLKERIDDEVLRAINAGLKTAVEQKMPELVNSVLETTYVPVNRWGEVEYGRQPTTFRAELVKAINGQMVYKKATYESDKNAFTKAVDAVISENMKKFQSEFDKIVHETFTKEAFNYAVGQLKKRLGIA